MTTKATKNPQVFLDAEGTTAGNDADPALSEAAMRVSAHQLAARLARLDLDAGTLEMVMAALAADVCDHVNLAGAQPED